MFLPGSGSEHEGHIHPGQRLGEICQHGLLLAAGRGQGVRGEQETGQVSTMTNLAKKTKSNKSVLFPIQTEAEADCQSRYTSSDSREYGQNELKIIYFR